MTFKIISTNKKSFNENEYIETKNLYEFNNINEFMKKLNDLINLNLNYKYSFLITENLFMIILRSFKYDKKEFKNYNDMKKYKFIQIEIIINFNNFNELNNIMKQLKKIKCNTYFIKENNYIIETNTYNTIYQYFNTLYDIFKYHNRYIKKEYKEIKEKI